MNIHPAVLTNFPGKARIVYNGTHGSARFRNPTESVFILSTSRPTHAMELQRNPLTQSKMLRSHFY